MVYCVFNDLDADGISVLDGVFFSPADARMHQYKIVEGTAHHVDTATHVEKWVVK